MSEQPIVRLANEEDLRKIVDDYKDKNPSRLNPFTSVNRLRELLGEGLLGSEIGGIYAGFLCWYPGIETGPEDKNQKFAHIAEIKVKKEFSKRKVGEYLLLQALKEIERQEIPILYIDSPEGNRGLVSLYEKAGFQIFARTLHMRYLYPPDRHRIERPHYEARELAVFLVELREQCRLFMTAYSEIKEMIAKGPYVDAEGQRIFSAQIWLRIQAALAACTIASNILWPRVLVRKDGSDRLTIYRSNELKQILKLRGASPFPIMVRNAFAHIDEYLATWLPRQEEDIPWGWSISAFSKDEEPGDSTRAFRYFNITSMELRVADVYCNLREVMEQVKDIEARIPEEAQVFFGSSNN